MEMNKEELDFLFRNMGLEDKMQVCDICPRNNMATCEEHGCYTLGEWLQLEVY